MDFSPMQSKPRAVFTIPIADPRKNIFPFYDPSGTMNVLLDRFFGREAAHVHPAVFKKA
jgi:hypothetical protein